MNNQKSTSIISPLYVRLTHWLNALAVFIMIMSGLKIYNASPIFQFYIPNQVTLGGWLGGALLWHFAAMWVLVINGLVYLSANLYSGRFLQKFFPLSIHSLIDDLVKTLQGNLAHDDLSQYNTIQKLAYLFAMLDICILIMSGLAIWKSVQFPILREIMGGFDNARIVHFVSMSLIVLFIIVHLVMVILVPKTLRIMIFGK